MPAVPSPGKVYLLGAGPGDPELLTLKGRRVLEQAAVVLFDHLAPEQVLDFAPPEAERIYVGKKRAEHAHSQDEITAMLLTHARAGKIVVRVKGGDPYLFGRGGEEAEALADAGVPFEVVPGVTSPAGISAYAGIPLTHRDHTSIVSIITGHATDSIDWDQCSHAETLVILMGIANFQAIADRLIGAGRDPDTPTAVVRWATRPDQQSLTGTLAELPARVQAHGLKPPATIIVGEVTRLHSKLNWFEKLPLFGQRIVVTRPRAQAADMIAQLRALGAEPVALPTISINPPHDFGPLDTAIARLDQYDWLIFTSVNGVQAFFNRLDGSTRDLRGLRARIAAIGPATRAAIEIAHLKVDVMGDEFVAEGLLTALATQEFSRKRVLLVRAAIARDVLPDRLKDCGAEVEVVHGYRSLPAQGLKQKIALLAANPPDWITFTSSSTAQNFYREVDYSLPARVASIGPITSNTLRQLGIQPAIEAASFTVDGLVEALINAPRTVAI